MFSIIFSNSSNFSTGRCNVRGVSKDEEGKTYDYYLEGEYLEPKEEAFEWKEDKPSSILSKLSSLFKSINNN